MDYTSTVVTRGAEIALPRGAPTSIQRTETFRSSWPEEFQRVGGLELHHLCVQTQRGRRQDPARGSRADSGLKPSSSLDDLGLLWSKSQPSATESQPGQPNHITTQEPPIADTA